MDTISQIQEQADHIAFLLYNHLGTLQRDAAPSPLPSRNAKPQLEQPEQPQQPSLEEKREQQSKEMASSLVQAVKLFDTLVSVLPLMENEDMQLQRLASLQAESEDVGRQLAQELQEMEVDAARMREMFEVAADECLRLRLSRANERNE
eukprot:TRINITY_DN6080_c0_g1_i1.p1 TRINITY_DN6080_c0_g1~~TRINITY_DN6080_c0_g1_i1.p1  ORF type:complete len:149 (-),score=43.46 TRINITY_DN6080_c0_g1_i1:186-632(-)